MAKINLTINSERCKGCELCISVCPKHILALDHTIVNTAGYYPAKITNMEECIGCTSCARMCPEVAIRIEKVG